MIQAIGSCLGRCFRSRPSRCWDPNARGDLREMVSRLIMPVLAVMVLLAWSVDQAWSCEPSSGSGAHHVQSTEAATSDIASVAAGFDSTGETKCDRSHCPNANGGADPCCSVCASGVCGHAPAVISGPLLGLLANPATARTHDEAATWLSAAGKARLRPPRA